MKILFLGDVVGNVGCLKIAESLSNQIKKNKIDFVIVNGENADTSGVAHYPLDVIEIFISKDQDFASFTLLVCPDDFTESSGPPVGHGRLESSFIRQALLCQGDVEIPMACLEYHVTTVPLVAGCTKPRLDKMEL